MATNLLVAGSLSTSNNVTSAFDSQASTQWRYSYLEQPSFAALIDLCHYEVQTDFDSFSYNCSVNGTFTACANTYGWFSFAIFIDDDCARRNRPLEPMLFT